MRRRALRRRYGRSSGPSDLRFALQRARGEGATHFDEERSQVYRHTARGWQLAKVRADGSLSPWGWNFSILGRPADADVGPAVYWIPIGDAIRRAT